MVADLFSATTGVATGNDPAYDYRNFHGRNLLDAPPSPNDPNLGKEAVQQFIANYVKPIENIIAAATDLRQNATEYYNSYRKHTDTNAGSRAFDRDKIWGKARHGAVRSKFKS